CPYTALFRSRVRGLRWIRGRASGATGLPARAVISAISVISPPGGLEPLTRANPLSIVAMRALESLHRGRHDEQRHEADPCRDARGDGEALPFTAPQVRFVVDIGNHHERRNLEQRLNVAGAAHGRVHRLGDGDTGGAAEKRERDPE